MPAGSVPSNPSDYLEENRLQTLVSFLKAGFDMVVIDCPSAAEEPATMLIGKFVEQNIFVLNTESSTSQTLSTLNNLAINEKFKKISVVLNNKEI